MCIIRYSEEEIKRYLGILHNYTECDEERVDKCSFCQRDDSFTIYSGYKLCENCGCQNGHVLGYLDHNDNDRLIFRKKSIYQRKYHYEKKVNQISRRLELSDDTKCDLMDKLMKIDNNSIEKLNNQFNEREL